ncbi:hypothetical protein LUX01_10095 [Streptomyces sudanensis]|uniref:hypothetical protein n=1 Tax=Streptomyces sudanensis TaxID=436397 RepID=UPI0020CF10D7|nr:hypothetical protein [Streptomyces sudanensis]MCP9986998.1 hypothetical protein [Streptomyces sudanensis]
MLTTSIGGVFSVVTTATSVWVGKDGRAGDGTPQKTGPVVTPSAHDTTEGEPGAPDADASAGSPRCEIRLDDGLYCTGTAGITTYSHRDRASRVAPPLGPETLFVCWGRSEDGEVWYWVEFKKRDEPWGNVPARIVSTDPIPAIGLNEC